MAIIRVVTALSPRQPKGPVQPCVRFGLRIPVVEREVRWCRVGARHVRQGRKMRGRHRSAEGPQALEQCGHDRRRTATAYSFHASNDVFVRLLLPTMASPASDT